MAGLTGPDGSAGSTIRDTGPPRIRPESGKESRSLSPHPPGSGKETAFIGTRNRKRNLKYHSAPAPLSWASAPVGTSSASRIYAAATCTAPDVIVLSRLPSEIGPKGCDRALSAVLAEFTYVPQEMAEGLTGPDAQKTWPAPREGSRPGLSVGPGLRRAR
jgi:hypothetical protein